MLDKDFRNNTFILDGGLATEIERNGFSLMHDPLWSASLLYKNPSVIQKVHKSYLESGADIITTASYQANIEGFQSHLGLSVEESKKLLELSVTLARNAKEEFGNFSKSGKEILISGSVGPYGALLADGSEYSGNYSENMTHEELMNFHRPRIHSLIEAGVDLLAFETIPALKEAEALIRLLKEFPSTKAWLSFSCQTLHKTAHGENIGSAALSCANLTNPSQLIAIGANCCPPEVAETLLVDIGEVLPDYPLIVYPNSGEQWDTYTGWSGEKNKPNSSYLENLFKANAKVIGGCCRTTPDDIADIFKFFQAQKS